MLGCRLEGNCAMPMVSMSCEAACAPGAAAIRQAATSEAAVLGNRMRSPSGSGTDLDRQPGTSTSLYYLATPMPIPERLRTIQHTAHERLDNDRLNEPSFSQTYCRPRGRLPGLAAPTWGETDGAPLRMVPRDGTGPFTQ